MCSHATSLVFQGNQRVKFLSKSSMKLGGGFIYSCPVMRSNLSSNAHLFKPVTSEIVQDSDFFDWRLLPDNNLHSRRGYKVASIFFLRLRYYLSMVGSNHSSFCVQISFLRLLLLERGHITWVKEDSFSRTETDGDSVASRRNSAQIACLKPSNCKTPSVSLHFTSSAHAPDSRAAYLKG